MFAYEKKLQYPVKIKTPNPKLASFIITQYGGPNRIKLPFAPREQELHLSAHLKWQPRKVSRK